MTETVISAGYLLIIQCAGTRVRFYRQGASREPGHTPTHARRQHTPQDPDDEDGDPDA
jgi:hypothetical protein